METTLLKKKLAVTGTLAHWQFPHHIALVQGQKRTMNSSLCLKVYERLRAVPDTLAAVVVGSIKASSRARQCRSPCPPLPVPCPAPSRLFLLSKKQANNRAAEELRL